ncbi:MAG: hypothetical protein ACKOI2_14940 [Actinomycetota bacterium]
MTKVLVRRRFRLDESFDSTGTLDSTVLTEYRPGTDQDSPNVGE